MFLDLSKIFYYFLFLPFKFKEQSKSNDLMNKIFYC